MCRRDSHGRNRSLDLGEMDREIGFTLRVGLRPRAKKTSKNFSAPRSRIDVIVVRGFDWGVLGRSSTGGLGFFLATFWLHPGARCDSSG